ncbi:MAG: FecR family protein, partial [Candidatus Neomarinimicrobiota bacterium]|nr:FecR family protein [Candidatus Neomarinimicrobiota bacterium]
MFTRIILLIPLIINLSAQQSFGKITLPLGKVEISQNNSWSRAKPNQKVFEGNVIRTQIKSRCEITLTGGGKVRIGEKSELELNEADVKPMAKNFNANLKKGNVWVSAKAAFGEKKNIAIRTPTAVAAIRGTKYRAKAGDDESSVKVYDGKVDVNQAKNYIEERKEKRNGVGQSGSGGAPKFTLGPGTEIKAPTQVSGPFEVT